MEQKSLLLVVLIAALIVTVGLQTVQLLGLSSGSGGVAMKTSTSGAATKAVGQSSGAATGSAGSLQNLPSMVGGC